MKRVLLVCVLAAAAVWGLLMINAYQKVYTVVSAERKLETVDSLSQEDCWVRVEDSEGVISGLFAESSYCVSLTPGDKIMIYDGDIRKL